MSSVRLPPLSALLKSRDVEDPVNVWVHRPLAYAFVWAVYRTSITPNQVTLLATVVGVVAGGLWFWGVPGAMVAGGILLWTSAILDGADGILARAKKMQSEFGRALDGSADLIVALVTTVAGFHHCYVHSGDPLYWYVAPLALGLTLPHISLYDFYKESYLRFTRLDRGGEGGDTPQVERRLAELEAEGGDLVTRLAVKHGLLPLVRSQHRVVSLINPGAIRQGRRFTVTPETAAIYRRHNLGPMRLWAVVSLAPHTYLMSICAMADNLELYMWIRIFFMNAVFLVLVVWQRRATEATNAELSRIGAAPVLATQAA